MGKFDPPSRSWQVGRLHSLLPTMVGYTSYKVKRRGEEVWIYPHSANVMAAAGLRPIRHYIDKRRATIAKTIRDRPILLWCLRAERLEGTPCCMC